MLSFDSTPTRFGHLLAVASPRGLVAARVGDLDPLLAEHSAELPPFSPAPLPEYLAPLSAALEGGDATSLPLDVSATTFRLSVWEALRAIPPGETRTYSQVAQSISSPSAVRAVARACATNPVALAIPCHRVVRSDGSPTGFRWGWDLKCHLLTAERLLSPLAAERVGRDTSN